MSKHEHRQGLLSVLVERFESQHLARALSLKHAVAAGERIGEYDRAFLEAACREALESKHVVDGFPQYQPLFLRTVHLYREISDRALENEKKAFGIAGASLGSP